LHNTADQNKYRIHKVNAMQNTIPSAKPTTMPSVYQIISANAVGYAPGAAGRGFSGDNGAATGSKLSYLSGVFVDTNGVLYIADSGNARIRKA
jgi:hypothetical protein